MATVELSRNYDAVIDIHGSIANCGVVTIVPYPTLKNMALAKSIPLERTVIWYSKRSSANGPLAQHTFCPAIEIECGSKDNPNIAGELKECIGRILAANASGSRLVFEQEYYFVYGSQKGTSRTVIRDFQEVTLDDETFYPFLSAQQYEGILCYKMKKLAPGDVITETFEYNGT